MQRLKFNKHCNKSGKEGIQNSVWQTCHLRKLHNSTIRNDLHIVPMYLW
jgi:hypothetical protein